jgi:hypothetical protein
MRKSGRKSRSGAARFSPAMSSSMVEGRIPGIQQSPEFLGQAVRGLAFAVNRPLQQRPSHHRLDRARQRIGSGPQQLACFDGPSSSALMPDRIPRERASTASGDGA